MRHDIHYRFDLFTNYLARRCQLEILARHGSLPHHEEHDALYRGTVKEVMDRVGALAGWSVYRPCTQEVVAHRDDAVVVRVRCHTRPPLVACTLSVWAVDVGAGRRALGEFLAALGEPARHPRAICVDWCFEVRSGLESIRVQEQIEEEILGSAYPWLPQPLPAFTRRFLESKEPVLVVYGAPGTGKTRLIRHLLAAMSDGADRAARVLYTADQKLVESDEFFVEFMIRDYDALVIEDADHLLEPRKDGNRHLHRFLGVSDGLLQPRGRRLIFSTNLPSRPDIDEALLRPGRCFACIGARKLNVPEVRILIEDLVADSAQRALALQHLLRDARDRYSLAEVWSAVRQTTPAEHAGPPPETGRHLEARSP